MKKSLLIVVLIGILCLGATLDRRHDDARFPIGRYQFAQQTWAAAVSTATTADFRLNGTIKAMEIVTGTTTDNITFTVALATSNGTALFSEAALADATKFWRDSESSTNADADFNPIPVNDTITATFTPSAVPGATGATLDLILYLE